MKAKYIYQINKYPTMLISFVNVKGNQLSITQTIKKVVREAINQFEIKQYSINLICHVIYIGLVHCKKNSK